jgi:hypothetical protein
MFVLCVLVLTSVASTPFGKKPPPPGGMEFNQSLGAFPESGETMTAARMKEILPRLGSGNTVSFIAGKLGVDSIKGKKLDATRVTELDNPVSADTGAYENEPSMAVNPANEAIVVVFTHFYGFPGEGPCQAMISYDGGDTFDWNNYYFPPVTAGYSCSDPVVRFSPDGSVVYYEYMNVDPTGTVADILVHRALGYAPDVAIGTSVPFPNGGGFMDKNWLDVNYYAGTNPGYVYATTTLFGAGGDCAIMFNQSDDYGATWEYGAGGMLVYDADCDPFNAGSRPIGAPDGRVIACWYHTEADGWLTGVFDIRCRENTNWGINGFWGAEFTAVNDKKFELEYYLGPSASYHRLWGSMFPVLGMDPEGFMYIAFAADPSDSATDAQAGDVFYTYNNSPYSFGWVAPKPVGTGATAQIYPAVSARYDPYSNKMMVYIAYSDYLNKNLFYNTVYRRGTRSPASWAVALGAKVILSDVPSMSDYSFIGDYIDSAVTSRRYHVVWTDRSDVWSIYDYDDDVMHDVVKP